VKSRAALRRRGFFRRCPATAAGIQAHDLLTEVNEAPIVRVADLERALYHAGPYGQAFYTITRAGIPLDTPVKVIPEPLDRSLALGLRVIGLIYLVIGFYVLFRRWGAPRATHFYLFCLVSFALYALKYTTKLDTLDWTVFWSNVLAESLQPALFLHFALCFLRNGSKKSTATGYCLWYTRQGRGYSGCGYGLSKPGCQQAFCCIA